MSNRSKLTQAEVDQIRILHREGKSQAALGRQYGVSQKQVSRIVRIENWLGMELEAY